MNSQEPEKKTEIWLKYCEDCIKSKIENDNSTFSKPVINSPRKRESNL